MCGLQAPVQETHPYLSMVMPFQGVVTLPYGLKTVPFGPQCCHQLGE